VRYVVYEETLGIYLLLTVLVKRN